MTARPTSGQRRRKAITCEDCFFRRRGLCALIVEEPCSTFRPDRPEGLVPPRQPALLMRWEARARDDGELRAA